MVQGEIRLGIARLVVVPCSCRMSRTAGRLRPVSTTPRRPGMAIQRMDNVLIVVEDIDAVIAFFVEIGMELEGRGPVEGRWVERVIALDDVRQEVAMLRV